MSKVKIGVIGTGTIAEHGHLPNYQQNTDVELVAFADTNVVRAEQMAAKYHVSKVYSDAEEMLKNEKLDAVSICTSNDAHIALAKLAIGYGVDVLVEKPIGTSYQEAQELVERSEQQNRICMVGMTHRFRNESQALKQIVEANRLGEIYYAKVKILRRRGTPTGWFSDFSRSGGGPLMDIGVHALDLAWWILGQPEAEKISGFLKKGIGSYNTKLLGRWESSNPYNRKNEVFDVEDFAAALIRFKSGLVMNLEVSWAMNGAQDDAIGIDVYGTEGGVSLDPLCYYSEVEQFFTEAKLDVSKNNPMKDEINHFVSCVQKRTTPLIPAEQGAEVLRMLEGITESSKQNQEILLDSFYQKVK
ncbi:oxidoreductase [Bacillus sp. SA1-12]|uniref:Gfo/Idh/MocA family protein n=1 Tax=Bacillus sp. SA1-12 TaxID=1455638 RepID=UPI000625A35D|nr:Gfo/Idh/MocA family oxidoreductase [Bacillus sp. SA1-12]KKI92099.1 oxidoreductase [Bacillus sp. SA1-12]